MIVERKMNEQGFKQKLELPFLRSLITKPH